MSHAHVVTSRRAFLTTSAATMIGKHFGGYRALAELQAAGDWRAVFDACVRESPSSCQ